MAERGKRLTLGDMRFVNEIHFNTVIGMNFVFEPEAQCDTDKHGFPDDRGYKSKDANGEDIIAIGKTKDNYELAQWEVLKNSNGRNGDLFAIKGDLRHFRFLDASWAMQDKRLQNGN
jgi:hypothetical protein